MKNSALSSTSQALRRLWLKLPLSARARLAVKAVAFRAAAPLIRHTGVYKRWNTYENLSYFSHNIAGRQDLATGVVTSSCLIVATPHTMYVAHLLARVMTSHGYIVTVADSVDEQYRFEIIFAVCPQFFPSVRDGYIAVQLEQHVASRWFTDRYIGQLKRAAAILDYARSNIGFLQQRGIALDQLFYLPIDIDPTLPRPSSPKTFDVLFYGDMSSVHRQKMLAALSKRFRVEIVGNCFGAEMQAIIQRARLVVNIHYYDGAVLETTRINEVLSLGVPVVSETSPDIAEHEDLCSVIDLAPAGDVAALSVAIERLLMDDTHYAERLSVIDDYLAQPSDRFSAYLNRFLFARNLIGYDALVEDAKGGSFGSITGNQLVLTLAETPERTKAFVGQKRDEFALFCGQRSHPGWRGCAFSYKLMFDALKAKPREMVTICEDDALLPDDYDRRVGIVHDYLKRHQGQWDVFSGFIADFSTETRILKAETYNGVTFLWIDRAVSMVYNIYSERAIALLSEWQPNDRDVHQNTIDRFMEKLDLRIIVAYPFLAEHDERLSSSVWGFDNAQYNGHIARSNAIIADRLKAVGIRHSAA